MRLDLALRLNSVGTRGRGGGVPPAFATGVYSFNGNVLDGETCTIGTTVYRFVTTLSVAYDVLRGATASITNLNLIAAVNGGAGLGTVYGTGTFQHPDVTASDMPGAMIATAKIIGVAGNSIVTTSTSATATWGAPTLEGGVGASGFNPASLWAGGELAFLHDFFVASALRIASDGTGLPPTNSELVGWARSDDPTHRIATQVTEASRPTWLAGGILQFNGTSTSLLTTLMPGAAGSLFAKISVPAVISATQMIIGGSLSSTRCFIALDTSGRLCGGIGLQSTNVILAAGDLRGLTKVVGLTWDGTTVKLYVDGVLVYSAAQSGTTLATALRLGAANGGGTASSFFGGGMSYAFAINRALLQAEVGNLTDFFT